MTDTQVAHTHESGGDSYGFLIGMILLIAFVFFLFVYGLPVIRNFGSGGVQQEVTIPEAGKDNQTPQINVPDKVDVNINK